MGEANMRGYSIGRAKLAIIALIEKIIKQEKIDLELKKPHLAEETGPRPGIYRFFF